MSMPPPPIYPWRLILASASPRRRQLLQALDLPVEITHVEVDETPPVGMSHAEVAEHLARLKASAWEGTLANDQVLITADTTVLIGDELLNKPDDDEAARTMLALLAGNSHRVITGVCLRTSNGTESFSDVATVSFAVLSAAEIAYYVDRYHPLDKAGAYGVQDWIGHVGVEHIDGNFYTVMGLPLHRVYKALKAIPVPPAS